MRQSTGESSRSVSQVGVVTGPFSVVLIISHTNEAPISYSAAKSKKKGKKEKGRKKKEGGESEGGKKKDLRLLRKRKKRKKVQPLCV